MRLTIFMTLKVLHKMNCFETQRVCLGHVYFFMCNFLYKLNCSDTVRILLQQSLYENIICKKIELFLDAILWK